MAFPEYKEVHVHVLQNVIKKLQRSFENMWERGAGFPKFKPFHRYNSFQFNNTGFKLMSKANSKRTRKQAKKAFVKTPHSTRPFTAQDYAALPNDPDRKPAA